MAIVAMDANVLVGLLDERDKWHGTAVAIRDALDGAGADLVYFDCVLNEAISVLARRIHEQRRLEEFDALLDQLVRLIPVSDITWVSRDIQRLYEQVLGLVRSSGGGLNFHDALMALVCREQDIPVLVSFDGDFDQVDWLIRAGGAADAAAALRREADGLPSSGKVP